MGRGRTEMKRIGNDVSRRAAFGKRRRGLLKKPRELAVLIGVDLGVLVFDDDSTGKQFDYCSPNTSWSELIERYESITNHQFQGIHHDDDQDYAYMQIKVIWSHLLRNFELKIVSPFPDEEWEKFIPGPRGKVMVTYKRRLLK